MTQEAMKLALEALESFVQPNSCEHGYWWEDCPNDDCEKVKDMKAITAIKEALAQPEQEPCVHAKNPKECYRVRCQLGDKCVDDEMSFRTTPPQNVIDKSAAIRIATALGWTPPRTWVGLTDEALDDVYFCVEGGATPLETWREQARTIEARLKQKNGYAEEKNT